MKRFEPLAERVRRDGLAVALDAFWIVSLSAAGAMMVWAALAPVPIFRPSRTVMASVTAPSAPLADDPFNRGAVPMAPAANASGFTLQAVRTGADGGSAILAPPGGAQRLVLLGEEAAPGLRLVSIAPDHVILEGPSGRVTIAFPQASMVTAFSAPTESPALTIAGLSLLPTETSGGSQGLRIVLSGETSTLGGTGLRDGDIITQIDRKSASSLEQADFERALMAASPVEIRFERAGQAMITHTSRSRP
jgi:general secretion pathway protein C